MTQRGPGPFDKETDADDETAVGERSPASYPVPPTSARPIAPYDPYRPPQGETPRLRRNVAADDFAPVRRPVSRATTSDPLLPDDDPLNADAWQLELDETAVVAEDQETLPEFDLETPPPRRARRQAAATRAGRESRSAAGRAPRRSRTPAASTHARAARPAVTLGMPRIVAGSSLVADPTVLMLLGINLAGILIMALVLGVRLGGLPAALVLQLDAAGNPDLWGPPRVLWRLPVMSLFITVMFLVVAWLVHPIDRFAARFALAAALVVQVVAWVAVIQHLG